MSEKSASEQIDDIIQLHGGWKAAILTDVRRVILRANPDIEEQVKWKTASRPEGLPVWAYEGNICLAEIWKDNVKLIFVKGAFMNDAPGLFNARLKSSTDRAIEFRESDAVDEAGLRSLVVEAVAINESKQKL